MPSLAEAALGLPEQRRGPLPRFRPPLVTPIRSSRTWGPGSLAVAGGGLVAMGVWPWLALPGPQQAPLAVGGVGALSVAVRGECERVRRQIRVGLWAALAPLTGMSRAKDLRVRRWAGWSGSPRSVRIRYASVCEDEHPQWQPEVIGVVQRRLGARYQVAKHDMRRCVLDLELVPGSGPVADDEAGPSAQDVRVQRLMRELLGPAAVASSCLDGGGQLTSIEVQHEAGVRVSTPAQRARVERVISSMLDGRWRARWDLTADRVRFEIRPTLPLRFVHPILPITDENRYRIFLGIDEDHGHGLWRFREGEPHLLIVGPTGRGKTVLINTVVMQWIRRGWPVRLCDPKRVELIGLRSWPNVEVVVTAVERIVAVIYETVREMERRYTLIEQELAREEDFEPLLLVIDEYRVLYAQLRAWYGRVKGKNMPSACPVLEQIAVIAAMGRTAGIHMVVGTQRPDAEFLAGEIRDNFRARVSLGPMSPDGARMMWESHHIGTGLPRGVPGRATLADESGRGVEAQTPWTPDPRRSKDPESLALLAQLRPTSVSHGPLTVVPRVDVTTLLVPDGPEDETNLSYRAWEYASLVPVDVVVDGPRSGSAGEPAPDDVAPSGVPGPVDLGLPRQRSDDSSGAGTRGPSVASPSSSASPPASGARPALRLIAGGDVAAVDVDELDELDELDDLDDLAVEEEDDFQEPIDIAIEQIQPGDLVLVEGHPDDEGAIWGVVESCEEDPLEDDLWRIDWRGDTDERGQVNIPAGEFLTVRHPSEGDA